MAVPALAEPAEPATAEATRRAQSDNSVGTGVARARDPLDSATSTSVLHDEEIERLGARSLADLLRVIPGLRVEGAAGEINASVSVRGLPIPATGSKYIQFQEDGLPTLEFGDITGVSGDALARPDLMLSQIEVIRGGSASTFASNSPGGVINLRSRTGEVDGGAVALSSGLDYDNARLDFTDGGHLSDSVRFQLGGFYRQGHGLRRTGYQAARGGQFRFNVTKEFNGGYLRLYGKHLDDRTPFYDAVPFFISGTDDRPRLTRPRGFDPLHDATNSRYLRNVLMLDRTNRIISPDLADGQHLREDLAQLEAQLDVAGWTVQERFRYARVNGSLTIPFNTLFSEINDAARQVARDANATIAYVDGDRAGERILSSRGNALNGNGLTAALPIAFIPLRDYGDVTNEVRVSRVFDVGGELTTTAGLYSARQKINRDILWTTLLSDIRGHGRSALIDVFGSDGVSVTDHGVYRYSNFYSPNGGNGGLRRSLDTDNAIDAPFASLNYRAGRVSIGASARYDNGAVSGRLWGVRAGSQSGSKVLDINGDGAISRPEQNVDVTVFDQSRPVDYRYHYVSYSSGITYRLAEPLALFARYSRGGRTPADRLMFRTENATNKVATLGASPVNPVRQAEAGVKYRSDQITLNLTGYWATVYDANYDPIRARPLSRDYEAKGLEFEGGLRAGVFDLRAGATYTNARIKHDYLDRTNEGHQPRAQPKLLFQASPALVLPRFALGASFVGATRSYTQDENWLTIPGYVTSNAFVQFRATDRLRLTLDANNLFDTVALMGIDTRSQPPLDSQGPDSTPLIRGRPLTGRTIAATLRADF
nr:TonB-dependent receptor [Sphingomonas yunnanensis]